MKPIQTLRAGAAALVLASPALLAPALAAQAAGTVWHEVMRGEDGTVVAVDSASISRARDSIFLLRTAVRFPQPMQLESGGQVDREVDVEELDCGAARIRGIESQLLFDTAMVRRVLLSHQWAPVEENRRPLFDARCGYLLGSFAASLPAGYELSTVDEQPELANRAEVAAALSRSFPAPLRQAGVSGTVTLRMRVQEDGRVEPRSIRMERATDPRFSEAARRVVQMMRFRPARAEGNAVAVWVTMPVSFELERSADATYVPGLPAGSEGHPRPAPETIPHADPPPPPLPRSPPRP